MRQQIKLLLTPSQYAILHETSVHEVFIQMCHYEIPYVLDDEGIKIPVTYTWDDNQ